MLNKTISSIHRYSNRFLRSTDLVRDFHDPNGLEGYTLTEFGQSCLNRIGDGFRQNSGRRAWRLTGDFGSGKSSFALLLANLLRDTRQHMPKELLGQALECIPEANNQNYVPILVSGCREPIAYSIISSLYSVLTELYSRGTKSELLEKIEKAVEHKKVSDKVALELLQEANLKIIQSEKGCGILLILDEVGKFLEFAALNPEQQDVFFLQQLAEMASRSGKKPFIVVCLLHQGFNAYSEQLAQSTQREWEKVASRFEEIIFQQPLDQIALLIASAINPDKGNIPRTFKSSASACLNQAIELGWYGTAASRATLRRISDQLFPLDPMLIPVIVRIFQRYGQNERSLFSFLCSHEPFGLRAFSQQNLDDNAHLFQLADFYDYVRANLGHKLAVASHRTHWTVIESIIEAHNPDKTTELRVLKTVGILNLLNADDLRPTKEAISWAVGGASSEEQKKVDHALTGITGRIIHFRGVSRGYSLWPYTSVDIESRIEDAKRAIPSLSKISEAISEQLDAKPIVARAHYIRTGNLRYFDVVYCKPDELERQADEYQTQADGFIVVPLCETELESKTSVSVAKTLKARKDLIRLVAVPRALIHLNQAALDAMRWEWIQKNTPELNNDRFARDEVYLNTQEAKNRLQTQIQQFVGLDRICGQSSLKWFYSDRMGAQLGISFKSGRQVLNILSDLCDQIYDKAPQIKNELANRHNLSSAAAAARMRLLELILTNADKQDLGMPIDKKPPEKSMYLSVFRKTNIHREIEGKWVIATPKGKEDIGNVAPSFKIIYDHLSHHPDSRVPIIKLMEMLHRPPFGLRDGLFPLFLAVLAVQHEHEIAFYDDGTFIREINKDVFLRMSKAPEKFEIQLCKIEGIRSELFQRLADVLELPKKDIKVELLDVVRKLCGFVAQLPEYSRNTKRLSQTSLAVRSVILEAREPVLMLFHDLPVACGFHKFEVGASIPSKEAQEFIGILKVSLDELRIAFPSLQKRMISSLSNEFGYEEQALSLCRKNLAERAGQLLLYVTESKLKAFAFRLFDDALPEPEWLESIGSLLALRPPNKWKDEEEDTFVRELSIITGRFKRAESLGFSNKSGNKKSKNAIRVAITQLDGSERQEVFHFDKDEERSLKELQDEISALIVRNKKLGVAAASRAIWSQLKTGEEIK